MATLTDSVMSYLKGEYGFLTILVIVIVGIAIFLRIKKARKNKQAKQEIKTAQEFVVQAPVQAPVQQQQPIMPQPVVMPRVTSFADESFLELGSFESEGLETIEKDTAKILSKKSDEINQDLVKQSEHVEKKLMQLAETERGIKELVAQLRINFNDVQRQKRTYELMRKSLTFQRGGFQ